MIRWQDVDRWVEIFGKRPIEKRDTYTRISKRKMRRGYWESPEHIRSSMDSRGAVQRRSKPVHFGVGDFEGGGDGVTGGASPRAAAMEHRELAAILDQFYYIVIFVMNLNQ